MRRCILVAAGLLCMAPAARAQKFGVGSPADSAALAKYRAQVDSVNKYAWKPAVELTPKDPTTAAVLGFLVTGAGQFYAGRPGKGAALFAVAAGAMGVGLASSTEGSCHDQFALDGNGALTDNIVCTKPNHGPLYAGIAVAAFSWLYGLMTAPDDVARYNAHIPTRTGSIRPVLDRGENGRSLVGLSFAFGR